jgi:hypothetical protein
MPETKRPLKVFLCHAHADRDAVRRLYIRLTKTEQTHGCTRRNISWDRIGNLQIILKKNDVY